MPYVNCPECDIRSFALAPWSTVHSCPSCETPLPVPRVAPAAAATHRAYDATRTPADADGADAQPARGAG